MDNKKVVVILVIVALLLGTAAVVLFLIQNQSDQPSPDKEIERVARGNCGDGECDRLEREVGICPEDCEGEEEEPEVGPGVVYLGIMIHLEGWDDEVDNEIKFNAHASAARSMAGTLEDYQAKGTFEARTEFFEASDTWGDNVMLEMYSRGHGVGLHADLGGSIKNLNQKSFAEQLSAMKLLAEESSTLEIRHASGVCSELDWAKALIDAGFEFTTGGVAFCVMSMPEMLRPDEYKSCPSPGECHGTYPEDIMSRLHPWRIDSARNWLNEDPNGELVVLIPTGGLYSMYEEFGQGEIPDTGVSEFTREDVDSFIDVLEETIAAARDDQINIMYTGWSIGSKVRVEDPLLVEWLEAIQPYIDAGQVQWKSMNQMYDAYVDWEKAN